MLDIDKWHIKVIQTVLWLQRYYGCLVCDMDAWWPAVSNKKNWDTVRAKGKRRLEKNVKKKKKIV